MTHHVSAVHPVAQALAVAALLLTLPWTATAASGTNIQITLDVPTQCEVTVASSSASSSTPLVIDAQVQQDCNATHDISLLYPEGLVQQPQLLSITFDGVPSDAAAPGSRTFSNLPPTTSTKTLHISYSGGTVEDRVALAAAWHIGVTAH